MIDILINLNTSFYSKGLLVHSRAEILKKYVKSNLLLDIITLFPNVVEVTKYNNIYFKNKYLILHLILSIRFYN